MRYSLLALFLVFCVLVLPASAATYVWSPAPVPEGGYAYPVCHTTADEFNVSVAITGMIAADEPLDAALTAYRYSSPAGWVLLDSETAPEYEVWSATLNGTVPRSYLTSGRDYVEVFAAGPYGEDGSSHIYVVFDAAPSVSISTSPAGSLGVSQPYTLTFSGFPPDFETLLYFEVWYEDAFVWESVTTPGTNPTFTRDFTPWSVGSGNLSVYVYYVEGTYDYVARAPVTVTYGSGSAPVAPPGPIPTLLPFANPVSFDREQMRIDINASVGGFPGVSGVITDYLDFSDGIIDGFSGLMLAVFSPFNSVIDFIVDILVTVRGSYLGLYTSLSGNLEFLLWLVTSAINCLPAKVQALVSFNLTCDLIVLLMRGVA